MRFPVLCIKLIQPDQSEYGHGSAFSHSPLGECNSIAMGSQQSEIHRMEA
jgi:hypothetical protein